MGRVDRVEVADLEELTLWLTLVECEKADFSVGDGGRDGLAGGALGAGFFGLEE